MRNAGPQPPDSNHWSIVGGPSPGTVTALAVDLCQGHTVFAGTRTGLYRCETRLEHREVEIHWQRLPALPLEIISLGLSPNYREDSTLFVGTAQGLFVSRNGGVRWQAAHTPMPDPIVLCFCFSPTYESDGIVLAGTLEDGIYYSNNRGASWSYRGFGLLDAAVYSLAISPNFAHDETVFAGAESALYYSYNGARAWKSIDIPEEAAPILSLALSPQFSKDRTIYAGTEHQGLYWSLNLGETWQKADLHATCVNALTISPEDGHIYAATNAGLYSSNTGEHHWTCLFNMPDVFGVTVIEECIMVNLVNGGAWLAFNKTDWRPFFTTPARSLTEIILSPNDNTNLTAFLYGAQEGIWRTSDGGLTWSSLNEYLPSLDIQSMALSSSFSKDQVLVAASGNSLLISKDNGNHWVVLADIPASHVVFSPDGKFIAAGALTGEIWVAHTVQGSWQSAPPPDGIKGRLLALAIDNNSRLSVALLEQTVQTQNDQVGESLSIWEGKPGQFEQILNQPAGPTPLVKFWAPALNTPDEIWYASLDHQLWSLQRRRSPAVEKDNARASLIFETENRERILSLSGHQTQNGATLFVCTGKTLYQTTETGAWTVIRHFIDEIAIDLALSPAYPDDPVIFALLLGGSVCRGAIKQENLASR